MDSSSMKITKPQLKPAVALSFALSFMLFIYAPLELYFQNQNEYWFGLGNLLPVCGIMFITALSLSILAMVIVRIINNKLYYLSIVIYFIAFLCTYIQGNYLAGNLPPLDGSLIPWDLYDYQRKYSIILWIVVTLLVCILWKYAHTKVMLDTVNYLAVGIVAVLAVTLVTVCITNDGLKPKLSMGITTDYELEMSKDENFVILMMDSMDAGKLSQMMAEHPEYEDIFRDFTFYKNTMGMYPYTSKAVPYMLSGYLFKPDETLYPYLIRVYKEGPLFDELENRGYRMGLYDEDAPLWDESMYRFENVHEINNRFSSVIDFIKIEMRLVGLRYMPYDLKKRCLVLPEEIPSLKMEVGETEYVSFAYSDVKLVNDLQERGITLTDDKCFRFIHIEGAHIPFRYDADLNIVDESNYEMCMEAAMKTMATYIQELKDSGTYDNTAIIIASDHGYNYADEGSITPEKRQNPMLFVKGKDEHHDKMPVSDAPISHEDLQKAYVRLLDGAHSDAVFDYKEGDVRERKYYLFYLWDGLNMEEYIQTGDAWNENTMKPTGVVYSW